MAVDIRVHNAAIIIESSETTVNLIVHNAAINIEYEPTETSLIVHNAAIMVEYSIEVEPANTYHTLFSNEVRLEDPGARFHDDGLVAYADFCAAEKVYFTRADEPGTSITGELSLGCWCWFDAPSTGAATGLISKWYETGNKRSYVLYKNTDNDFVFSISSDGTAVTTIDDAAANYAVSKWFFVAGVFDPESNLSLFVNGIWYSNVTSIPASIYDSDEALNFGRYNRANYIDGRMCQTFLCAYALPRRYIEALYAHSKAMFKARGT
jgi:hypothetical protein